MGTSKRRRQIFFSQNPLCCFCGGNTPATTEDHVPNRALFDQRQWPEGYSFPACALCNDLTRPDEKIIAFLSRIRHQIEPLTDVQHAELRKAMAGVHRQFPDSFASMRMTANQTRQWLREHQKEKPRGLLLSDIPMLSIESPTFRQAIRRFGIKLSCALHYKHSGQIVPNTAVVAGRWLSNVQIEDGAIPAETIKLFGGATVTRARNNLQDQFSYLYTVATEKTASAFLCGFRRSFAILGFVSYDANLPAVFDENMEWGAYKGAPFIHGSRASR